MNYIDQAAEMIKQRLSPNFLPKGDTAELFRGYAALMYSNDGDVGAEDVHNVWSAWASSADPGNKSIRPFDQLSARVQHEDEPYVEAIKAVWAEIQSTHGSGGS